MNKWRVPVYLASASTCGSLEFSILEFFKNSSSLANFSQGMRSALPDLKYSTSFCLYFFDAPTSYVNPPPVENTSFPPFCNHFRIGAESSCFGLISPEKSGL